MSGERGWQGRWIGVAGLVVAAALGFVLTVRRWSDAAGLDRLTDFDGFFLPAARSIRAGGSPYDVEGYVHPPLTALAAALVDWVADKPIPLWVALLGVAAYTGTTLFVLVLSRGLPLGFRAGMLAWAFITLLASRPGDRIFFLGQTDFFILLWLAVSLWAAQSERHRLVGFGLGMTALIKTWPVVFGVWIMRRGQERRLQVLAGAAIPATFAVLTALFTGGRDALAAMIRTPFLHADQGITSYSGFGLGKALFSDRSQVVPLVESPTLQWTTTLVVTVVVLGVLALNLRCVRDRDGQFVATVALCLLLIPVSQFNYLILALPVLWYWAAQVLHRRTDALAWAGLVTSSIFWFACFYLTPELAAPDLAQGRVGVIITTQSFLVQWVAVFANGVIGVLLMLARQRRDRRGPASSPALSGA